MDFKFTLKCHILPCLLRGDCCLLFEVDKSSHKSTFSWLIIKCKIRSSSSEMNISCEWAGARRSVRNQIWYQWQQRLVAASCDRHMSLLILILAPHKLLTCKNDLDLRARLRARWIMAQGPEPECVNIQMMSIVNHLFTPAQISPDRGLYQNRKNMIMCRWSFFFPFSCFWHHYYLHNPGSDTDRGPVTKEGCWTCDSILLTSQ